MCTLKTYLSTIRQYQTDPTNYLGLCGNNQQAIEHFAYSQDAHEHADTVRKYIDTFLLWKMISTSKKFAYYWPIDEKGTNIRLAILDTWITLGSMTNKKKFRKQLRIELQKYNLSLADLTR